MFDIKEKKIDENEGDEDDENDKEPDYNFKDLDDLLEIKNLIKNFDIGVVFNTSILRLALNFSEEMIAQTLVYEYKVAIKEDMIIKAVRMNLLQFLYSVFAFNMNFEYKPPDD